MTYKTSISIPRITAAQVAQLEAIVPGIGTVAPIPVIETETQAVTVGSELLRKSLLRYEYLARLESVEDTDSGWLIEYVVAGD